MISRQTKPFLQVSGPNGSGVGAGMGVGIGVGKGVGIGVGKGVGMGVGKGVGIGAGMGVGMGVGSGVGVGTGIGVGVGIGVGIGVGVGNGSGVSGTGINSGLCTISDPVLTLITSGTGPTGVEGQADITNASAQSNPTKTFLFFISCTPFREFRLVDFARNSVKSVSKTKDD
jgi:hypothetical protein